jgi:hypothetical protein
MQPPVLAVEKTQWIIAIGSLRLRACRARARARAQGLGRAAPRSASTARNVGVRILKVHRCDPAEHRLDPLAPGTRRAFASAVEPAIGLSFDGTWPQAESSAIWTHFLVDGPFPTSRNRRKLRHESGSRVEPLHSNGSNDDLCGLDGAATRGGTAGRVARGGLRARPNGRTPADRDRHARVLDRRRLEHRGRFVRRRCHAHDIEHPRSGPDDHRSLAQGLHGRLRARRHRASWSNSLGGSEWAS